MHARVVDCAPDPMLLARRIAERTFPAFLVAAPNGSPAGRFSWLACDPDDETARFDPLGGEGADPSVPAALASFPRFIGVLPYEARRSLERPAWSPLDTRALAPLSRVSWLRYPAVARVDHLEGRVMVAGSCRAAVDDLAKRLAGGPLPEEHSAVLVEVSDGEPAEHHLARVRSAIELIRAGDLYQVNLARRIGLNLSSKSSPAGLLNVFESFARAAPSSFGAFLATPQGTVLSTSPELCLRAEASADRLGFMRILTEPIKGTRPRGRDAAEDAQHAADLERDPKELAELAMIIDVERNDLHRVATTGSVRLLGPPHVVTHRTVHHRLALLSALVRPGVSREEVVLAMLPSGSVTGAPKIRAMEVIRSLEPVRRGLYTGALGYQAHDGSMLLSMAIRTAVFAPDSVQGEYLVGGGIVVGSSPERELAETRWKAAQLRSLLGKGLM